jgi:hypothetical protein
MKWRIPAVAAVMVACVPAGASVDPRGATGAVMTPSAATRGEPFVTKDGWTVRIDELAFVTMLTVRLPDAEEENPSEERFLWNPMIEQKLVVRAVRTGKGSLFLLLTPPGKRIDPNGQEVAPYVNQGIAAAVGEKLAEGSPASVIARVHAEKGAERRDIELRILTPTPRRPEDATGTSYEVVTEADAVTDVPFDVHAEILFQQFQTLVDQQAEPRPLPTPADGIFVRRAQ